MRAVPSVHVDQRAPNPTCADNEETEHCSEPRTLATVCFTSDTGRGGDGGEGAGGGAWVWPSRCRSHV